jgi:ClpP class serine protease
MINALSKLYGDVWAITPEAHRALCEVVARMPADTREEDEYAGSLVFDGIQHIHVKGVTVSSCPQWAEEMFGLCSMEKIAAQLETAIIRPDVKGVLMVYDTPGGYLPGIPGVARVLANFPKPVVGYVAGACASAGYWLACSQTLYAAEESAVGSIGVYMVLRDSSKAYEMSGLRTIMIATGEHKGAGEDGTEITDAHITHLRDEVIAPMGKMFFGHVQAQRRLDESLLDGRAWRGVRAVELGLVDAVGDMSAAIEEIHYLTKGDMP